MKRILLALFFVCCLGLNSSPARAESMTWQFRNYSGELVMLELYSQSRRNHAWPGNRRVYYVPADSEVHTYPISCIAGEYICYGAWIGRQTNLYWGVGYGGRQRCADCCNYCSGGEVTLRNLTSGCQAGINCE